MNKFEKVANIESQVYFPNLEDWNEDFYKHNYLILVTTQGIPFAVNAANEQEAIDYIIDYCEDHLLGLIMSREEEETEEYLDEYIHGGNHGRYLNTHNIHIESL